jgi:uncharacterized protein YegJ (DUF2314 family)
VDASKPTTLNLSFKAIGGLYASYFLLRDCFLATTLAPVLGADTAVDRADKDEIISVPKGDLDMEVAFRHARDTLKGFLGLARVPRSSITSMAVKVAIHHRGETEYFWISPFKEKDDGFVGTVDNTPRSVRNIKLGKTITFQTGDIVDWLYREDGKMFGDYTAGALVKQAPPSKRKALAREYGLNCDSI